MAAGKRGKRHGRRSGGGALGGLSGRQTAVQQNTFAAFVAIKIISSPPQQDRVITQIPNPLIAAAAQKSANGPV